MVADSLPSELTLVIGVQLVKHRLLLSSRRDRSNLATLNLTGCLPASRLELGLGLLLSLSASLLLSLGLSLSASLLGLSLSASLLGLSLSASLLGLSLRSLIVSAGGTQGVEHVLLLPERSVNPVQLGLVSAVLRSLVTLLLQPRLCVLNSGNVLVQLAGGDNNLVAASIVEHRGVLLGNVKLGVRRLPDCDVVLQLRCGRGAAGIDVPVNSRRVSIQVRERFAEAAA